MTRWFRQDPVQFGWRLGPWFLGELYVYAVVVTWRVAFGPGRRFA